MLQRSFSLFAIGVFLCVTIVAAESALQQRQTGQSSQTEYDCATKDLPTSWAFDHAPATIEQHSVSFTAIGRVWQTFAFSHLLDRPVEAFAAILEYKDADGRNVDVVTYSAATDMARQAFRLPFATQHVEKLKAPVPPGKSVLLGASYDGVRTRSCPTTALVTFAAIKPVGRPVRTFAGPTWSLGPIPRRFPRAPDAPPSLGNVPFYISARLVINESGQVVDVIANEQTNTVTLAWIRQHMKQYWEFHPALVNGSPVATKLPVVLNFPVGGISAYANDAKVPAAVTLIQFFRRPDLYPTDTEAGKLAIVYGGMSEDEIAH